MKNIGIRRKGRKMLFYGVRFPKQAHRKMKNVIKCVFNASFKKALELLFVPH